jgi:hypothetical protein
MKNVITLEEKHRIVGLCKGLNLDDYTINDDGTVDVRGDVYITH